MSTLPDAVREFLDAHIAGVLSTVSPEGRARQSVVYYVRAGQRLLISTESKRLKARDVRRAGWASLCVMGAEKPFPSATVAGPAEILTTDIGPATAAIAQRISGAESPPQAQTDEALAAVDRVILQISVERVGPVSYLSGS